MYQKLYDTKNTAEYISNLYKKEKKYIDWLFRMWFPYVFLFSFEFKSVAHQRIAIYYISSVFLEKCDTFKLKHRKLEQ